MIVGTGIDIAEVPRIRETIARHGERFLKRIFTEGEIQYCESKAKWLLGPEGAGLLYVRRERVGDLRPVGVGWHSVVKAWDFAHVDFTLKPTLLLHGKAAEFAEKLGARNIALSLTHTAEQAMAQVILES